MELNVYNVNACLDLTLFVDKHTYIGEDWDPINGFNPTSFLCLSQVSTGPGFPMSYSNYLS